MDFFISFLSNGFTKMAPFPATSLVGEILEVITATSEACASKIGSPKQPYTD